MADSLSDAYLQQCEHDARRFSGAYTGTSGTLAAHVMRLLAELSRVKGNLAVSISNLEHVQDLGYRYMLAANQFKQDFAVERARRVDS
jgi:hypothetical protein